MPDLPDYGDRLRQARNQANLTQRQLAAEICRPQSAIARLETNRHLPSLPMAQRIARTLGVSLDSIWGDPKVDAEQPASPAPEPTPPRPVDWKVVRQVVNEQVHRAKQEERGGAARTARPTTTSQEESTPRGEQYYE